MEEGEHSHTIETPPVIAPVIDTGNELLQPVIDHTQRITEIEQRQARAAEETIQQIAQLEERLANASGNQFNEISERIARLESRLEEQIKPVEEIPEDGVELAMPEVEASPAPPEKVRRGLRHRRRARRKGGS